jgi:general stress protein CsbA
MSITELCQRIQDAWVSRAIAESTWGYPIVGALHVLAIALFGGAVLAPHLRVIAFSDVRWIRRVGLALVMITGAFVFASGAVGYYGSSSFRIKMVLLGLIALNAIASRRHRSKRSSAIALVLWAAVIFASRGIAFF